MKSNQLPPRVPRPGKFRDAQKHPAPAPAPAAIAPEAPPSEGTESTPSKPAKKKTAAATALLLFFVLLQCVGSAFAQSTNKPPRVPLSGTPTSGVYTNRLLWNLAASTDTNRLSYDSENNLFGATGSGQLNIRTNTSTGNWEWRNNTTVLATNVSKRAYGTWRANDSGAALYGYTRYEPSITYPLRLTALGEVVEPENFWEVNAANLPTPTVPPLEFPATLYVSMNGNDSLAQAGDPTKSWATISNAVEAATFGDLVHIFSGSYTGKVNLKEGVTLYYAPGATHITTLVPDFIDFTFHVGAVTNQVIDGFGTFVPRGGYLFNSSNANFHVTMKALKIGNKLSGVVSEGNDTIVFNGSYKSGDFTVLDGINNADWSAHNTNTAAEIILRQTDWSAVYADDDVAPVVTTFGGRLNLDNQDHYSLASNLKLFGVEIQDNNQTFLDYTVGRIEHHGTRLEGWSPIVDENSFLSTVEAPFPGPFFTNIFGHFFQSNKFNVFKTLRVLHQGDAAKIELASRSGNSSDATGTLSWDATNKFFRVDAPILGRETNLTVTAAGSGAAIAEGSLALLDFATTDCELTLPRAGTYRITGNVWYARSAGSALDELNETPVSLRFALVFKGNPGVPLSLVSLGIGTTANGNSGFNFIDTETHGIALPEYFVTTSTNNAVIAISAGVSESLGAGTINPVAGTFLNATQIR